MLSTENIPKASAEHPLLLLLLSLLLLLLLLLVVVVVVVVGVVGVVVVVVVVGVVVVVVVSLHVPSAFSHWVFSQMGSVAGKLTVLPQVLHGVDNVDMYGHLENSAGTKMMGAFTNIL